MSIDPTSSSSPSDPYEADIAKVASELPGKGIPSQGFNFLGMHFTGADAKVLWNTIIQAASQQIQHDQDLAIQAIQRMNPDKNPDNQ